MSRRFAADAMPRPSWPQLGEVARSLLGLLLAVVLALEWGPMTAAVAAGGGAAVAGAVALQDNPRRTRQVLGVSAAAGLAVSLGTLTIPHGVLYVLTVVVWSVGAGLMWALSAPVGLVAGALGVLMVSASHQPSSVVDAAVTGTLTMIGGLTQVLLVTAWPRLRWNAQRAELAGAYRSVSRWARDLAADSTASFDVSPLFRLRDTSAGTEFGMPERIAMSLTALRSNSPATCSVVAAAADALDAIAGGGRGARADADGALAALKDAVDRAPEQRLLPARRLQEQLREAAALRFTGSTVELGVFGGARESLRDQLSWNSPILRHAVRLGCAVGVGTAAAAATGMAQGYWIALSVLLVLRPETAHTYTRCAIRVVAVTVGVALATSVSVLWQPSDVVAAVVAAMFVGVAYSVSGLGNLPAIAASVAAIVFLVDIGGSVHSDTLGERLVATTLGGTLAIASHLLFPDRSLVRLHQRAGELLKAEIDYAATVIRAFVQPVAGAEAMIAAGWERVVRARSAFEAASGTARADAPAVRRWLTTYRAGLNGVTGSCAVLEAHMSEARPGNLDRRFVVAVDDYVDVLRGEAPRAGRAWTLDATHLVATHQQLRESAAYLARGHVAQRVLVAEVETITRHLLTLADAT